MARASAVALSLGLGAIAVNCGSKDDVGSVSPCEGALRDQCGQTCTQDGDCGAGLYCGFSGTCSADCAPGANSCPEGFTCNPRGRCAQSTGGFGGGGPGAGAGGSSGSSACADVDVTFTKQTPTVMLLLDQSGSMTERFGSAPSRWDALYDTLMDPNSGVVKALEGDVRFGLALYTSNDGNAGGTCPLLTKIPIALNNFDEIDAVYSRARPEGETPTGESIAAVATDLMAFTEPGPKVIVLATDGEPDTCAVPNPQNGQPESIAAAQAAYEQGIQTYVVSVGDDVGAAHLQDMANAGAGLPIDGGTDATYYVALDQATLIDAFSTIIGSVRSCTITLDGVVAEADASQGTVTLDGQELAFGDENGWTFHAPDGVELLGEACATIQEGEHDLRIVFPCNTVIPR